MRLSLASKDKFLMHKVFRPSSFCESWPGHLFGTIAALSQNHNRKLSSHHQLWPWTRTFRLQRLVVAAECRHRCCYFGVTVKILWEKLDRETNSACPFLQFQFSDMPKKQFMKLSNDLDAHSHWSVPRCMRHFEQLCRSILSLFCRPKHLTLDWPWIAHATQVTVIDQEIVHQTVFVSLPGLFVAVCSTFAKICRKLTIILL